MMQSKLKFELVNPITKMREKILEYTVDGAHAVNDVLRRMKSPLRLLPLLIALLIFCPRLQAQTAATPAPSGTTVNVMVGAEALGLATSGGQPGTDVIAGVNLNHAVTLRSDNLIVPGENFQAYFGGVQYPVHFLSSTSLKSFLPYVTASAGVSETASASHFASLAGGGLNYMPSTTGPCVNIIEIRWLYDPGNPQGRNEPVVAGGISFFFGH